MSLSANTHNLNDRAFTFPLRQNMRVSDNLNTGDHIIITYFVGYVEHTGRYL